MAEQKTHAENLRARREVRAAKDVEVRQLREAEQKENKSATALDAEIAALAQKATSGDRDALTKQRKLIEKQSEHTLQAKNLAGLAVPIEAEIAKIDSEIPALELSEQIEALLERTPELTALSKQLTEMIPPVARAFGECLKKTMAVVATSRPLLADHANIQQLDDSIRHGFNEGIRAQLHRDFNAEGYVLFGSLKGASFEDVVRPKLNHLLVALESTLATQAGFASPGRAFFLAKTNISRLLGMNIRVGQTISLPIDDENVQKMCDRGALERVADEKAVSA
jgi:hypothetical protein